MQQVLTYSDARQTGASRRQRLIYDNVEAALGAMPGIERERRTASSGEASLPGLVQVRLHEKVVALGRTAHLMLADCRKQTLVVDDWQEQVEDLARLIWSCVNTTKVVALGMKAWRSIQLLPVAERRFFEVPPLRMTPVGNAAGADLGDGAVLIDHEGEVSFAEPVRDALVRAGFRVQTVGADGSTDGGDDGWSTEAAIHVHLGHHGSAAEKVRLLDTWHSRRYAIQYNPRRAAQPPLGTLTVDAEHDGFLCQTPSQVVAACADLRADPVLRKKVLHAGAARTAPLAQAWLEIASELLGKPGGSPG